VCVPSGPGPPAEWHVMGAIRQGLTERSPPRWTRGDPFVGARPQSPTALRRAGAPGCQSRHGRATQMHISAFAPWRHGSPGLGVSARVGLVRGSARSRRPECGRRVASRAPTPALTAGGACIEPGRSSGPATIVSAPRTRTTGIAWSTSWLGAVVAARAWAAFPAPPYQWISRREVLDAGPDGTSWGVVGSGSRMLVPPADRVPAKTFARPHTHRLHTGDVPAIRLPRRASTGGLRCRRS
jgi:hypothetical protein